MTQNDCYALCEGKTCALKETCKRYQDGSNVDRQAEGYYWMPHCDVETRLGYMPTGENRNKSNISQ